MSRLRPPSPAGGSRHDSSARFSTGNLDQPGSSDYEPPRRSRQSRYVVDPYRSSGSRLERVGAPETVYTTRGGDRVNPDGTTYVVPRRTNAVEDNGSLLSSKEDSSRYSDYNRSSRRPPELSLQPPPRPTSLDRGPRASDPDRRSLRTPLSAVTPRRSHRRDDDDDRKYFDHRYDRERQRDPRYNGEKDDRPRRSHRNRSRDRDRERPSNVSRSRDPVLLADGYGYGFGTERDRRATVFADKEPHSSLRDRYGSRRFRDPERRMIEPAPDPGGIPTGMKKGPPPSAYRPTTTVARSGSLRDGPSSATRDRDRDRDRDREDRRASLQIVPPLQRDRDGGPLTAPMKDDRSRRSDRSHRHHHRSNSASPDDDRPRRVPMSADVEHFRPRDRRYGEEGHHRGDRDRSLSPEDYPDKYRHAGRHHRDRDEDRDPDMSSSKHHDRRLSVNGGAAAAAAAGGAALTGLAIANHRRHDQDEGPRVRDRRGRDADFPEDSLDKYGRPVRDRHRDTDDDEYTIRRKLDALGIGETRRPAPKQIEASSHEDRPARPRAERRASSPGESSSSTSSSDSSPSDNEGKSRRRDRNEDGERNDRRRSRENTDGSEGSAANRLTSSTQAVTAIAKRREAERDAEAPRGILRKPTDQFPEPEGFIREGAQPHKDRHAELLAQGLDPQARWTKVSRDIINPRALEIGLERFEILNEDEIVILRVMTPSELESFAKLTAAIREQERLQAREERRQKRKQLAIEGPPSGTDGAGAGPEQAGPKERKFRFAEGTKMGDGEVENSQAPAAKARARDMEDERRAEPSKLLAPVGTEYRPRDLEAEREHGPRRDRDEGPVERERSPRQERDRDDNRKHRERSPLPPPGPDSEDREPERHGSFVVPPAGTMSMSGMPPPPMDMNRLMPPMPPGPSGNRSGSRRNSNEPTQVRPVFSPEPEQLDRSRGGFIPPPAGSTFNSNSLSSSSDVGRGSSTSTYLPPNHSQPLNVSGGGGIAGQGGLGPPMPPPPPQPPVAMTVASSSSGYSDDGRSHDRRRGDDRERDDRRGRRERDHGREHGRERDREGERSRESDDRDERDDRHGGHDGRHRSERDHEKDRGRDEMDDLAD